MFRVELGGDDFDGNGDAVKLAKVARAIEKVLLADGSTNKFQAERDAWPLIYTGITAGKLHVFNPANLEKYLPDNCNCIDGLVHFDELVAWGQWCKHFEFVKQAAPAANVPRLPLVVHTPERDTNGKLECNPVCEKLYFATNAPPPANGEYVPLFPLLAEYWDKPLSELPEELRVRVSLQVRKRLAGHRPKYDASGELERDAEGHYPVWEEVYAEHQVGDFMFSWDGLSPEHRRQCVTNIDNQNDPEKIKAQQYYSALAPKKDAIEREIRKWELMHHGNDPVKAKIQDDKLAELRTSLEDIKQRFKLPPPDASAATGESCDAPGEVKAARIPVATQQKDAILNWLKVSQHDPLKLPVPPSGKAGVKKLCRDALCESSKQLFSSASVFNTAWDRLRANDEIKDK